ncbi:DUF6624 domain-containing protein [Streptomyces luteireticuli]|uniref:DUF6624 domain-containing protein n=1 Tax=Streptomyces luteireticuli TaxID=173858 RepID=UPI0035562D9B
MTLTHDSIAAAPAQTQEADAPADAPPAASARAATTGAVVQRPDIADDLLNRATTARQYRRRLAADFTETKLAAMQQLDLANARVLHRIVDVHGWPGTHLVGVPGAEAAWQIALHADGDTALQHTALQAIHTAVGQGTARPDQWARLYDRCRVNSGLPQVYGTQYWYRPGVGVQRHPVTEPEHLQTRRAGVQLPPANDRDATPYKEGQTG